jgi:DNA invertase Pin-like site-specific DNA recombinase
VVRRAKPVPPVSVARCRRHRGTDAIDALELLDIRLLSIGASVHDLTEPVGRLLFTVLAMVAEFEADLIRLPRACAR